MAPKKKIKRYAVDLVKDLRNDNAVKARQSAPSIDFGDVISISPEIVIEPHHSEIQYDEDDLVFNIDLASLKVGDTVVLGKGPSEIPIVMGISDGNNEDPFLDPDLLAFKENADYLRENTQHWKSSVSEDTDLPTGDNDDGDLRFSKGSNVIFRWNGDSDTWVAASGTSGTFLPLSGGTMIGDIIMAPGTMITLPDPPINPSDVVNKAYVDALVAACCGGPPAVLVPTVTISVANNTPCYAALPGDQVILVNCSGGIVYICLPAVHTDGKIYEIKDISGLANTNNIIIGAATPDTIDGAATFTMNVDDQAVTVISDGTNWYIF